METETIKLSEIVGGGYDRFWSSRKRYRVLKGGKGSKKSCTTALNLILRLIQNPGANLLVVRQVMDTHRNSTFAQLWWAVQRLSVTDLWKRTVSPMEMIYLPTGQKIIFRGFDDVMKLASTTVDRGHLCWVWIEEAYEVSDENEFDTLDLSVPRGSVPKGLYKQTTLTFNPWSEHHWLKKRFFDSPSPEVDVFTTTYRDNEFLDDTDLGVFRRMERENPRKYAVAGLGNWGIADGLIFEDFHVEAFDPAGIGLVTRDGKRVDESYKYRHIFGLDYGYTNDPTAFIAAAVNPVDKLLYIYDEHYETRMLNSDIAAMIQKKGYAKERIYADCAEPKSNEDLRRLGIGRITPSVKGKDSILNGIAAIQEYRIMVHPRCKNTVMELSSYRWQRKNDQSGQNRPCDDSNHLMDALRYAFQDVKYFTPQNPAERVRRTGSMLGGILPEDLRF